MKRAITILQSINTVASFTLGYITFFFLDSKELSQKMDFFQWKYFVFGVIIAVFTAFLIWSIRKIIILSVKETVLHSSEERWIFLRDAIVNTVYKDKHTELYHSLIADINGRKELKYTDEFLTSLGLTNDEVKDFRDAVGTMNALPKLLDQLFERFNNSKDEPNSNQQQVP